MSGVINRVTPESIVHAFKESGLKPKQGYFFKDGTCACALGALYAQLKGIPDDMKMSWDTRPIADFMDEHLGNRNYRFGITHGFDGDDYDEDDVSDEFLLGYNDGVAAREALIQSGMMEG